MAIITGTKTLPQVSNTLEDVLNLAYKLSDPHGLGFLQEMGRLLDGGIKGELNPQELADLIERIKVTENFKAEGSDGRYHPIDSYYFDYVFGRAVKLQLGVSRLDKRIFLLNWKADNVVSPWQDHSPEAAANFLAGLTLIQSNTEA